MPAEKSYAEQSRDMLIEMRTLLQGLQQLSSLAALDTIAFNTQSTVDQLFGANTSLTNQGEAANWSQHFASTELLAGGAQHQNEWWAWSGEWGCWYVARVSAGGTYRLEVDWSLDAVDVFATEEIPTAANGSPVPFEPPPGLPQARFRVKNVGSTAFATHRTVIGHR